MKFLPWVLISLFAIVAFATVFIVVKVSLPKKKVKEIPDQPVIPADKIGEYLKPAPPHVKEYLRRNRG